MKKCLVVALLISILILFLTLHGTIAQEQDQLPAATVLQPDPTVTAFEKEKLRRELSHLRYEDEHPLRFWFQDNAAVLVALVGGSWAVFRWLQEQQFARERHDYDRFQSISDRLSSNNKAARLSAAISLRSFLNPGYEPYYGQVFSFAVAVLRFGADPSQLQIGGPLSRPTTPLNQALVLAFRESYPLARDYAQNERPSWLPRTKNQRLPNFLPAIPWFISSQNESALRWPMPDASGLSLSNVNLSGADLRGIWMPDSSFTICGMAKVDLGNANLQRASFVRCNLVNANFNGADLTQAGFGNFTMTEANMRNANLSNARLTTGIIQDIDLSDSNPEDAATWERVRMVNVTGLTDNQRLACVAKGATFEN